MLNALEPLALFCELVLHHLRIHSGEDVPPCLVPAKDGKVIGSVQRLAVKSCDPQQFHL